MLVGYLAVLGHPISNLGRLHIYHVVKVHRVLECQFFVERVEVRVQEGLRACCLRGIKLLENKWLLAILA